MRMTMRMKKAVSGFLAMTLLLSHVPVPALAAEEGSCPHHVHDGSCGYVEAVEGKPCNHQCGEDCTVIACVHDHEAEGCVYTPARDLVPCDHVHDETCNYNEAEDTCDHQHGECAYQEAVDESWDCAHVCTVDSGCVKTLCAHVCHEDDCGFVEAAGHDCEFVCTECESQGDSEDDEDNTVQTVNFMEYLEDDPILIAFQSSADIDLHDYLVNAYRIPGKIPFTCEPAVVSYGEYEDGSLISVTITAGEGYEGSCTVEAEVRYMNAFAEYHVYPTVTYLVNRQANYGDAVGEQLLSVTIQAERECWYEFYEVDGNSYMPFNGIFQDGFSPDFTIRVYIRSNQIIQAGIGVNGWGRQGDGRAIYKDFTFHFQNSPYVNLPDVTWTNYQRDWLYQYYKKVDLPYTGKLQDFATVDSYSNGDVTKENCSGISAGTYTAKVTVKLNDGLSALDSQSLDYAGIKWQEEAQESGQKVYTKTNTVTIVPVNPTVTTTPGSLTINASTEYTPADLVADSGAGIQVTGIGDDGILPANISYTWSDGTSAAKVPGTSETIKATITPTGPLAQNYNTVTASVTVDVTKKITGKSYYVGRPEYNGMGQNLAIVNWSDSGVLYTIVYQDSQGNTYSGSDLPVYVDEYTVSVQLSDGWLFEDGTTKQDLPKKAEITPKSVRLTDIVVAEKIYDGTNTAEDIGTFEIDGILAADKADITHHANYTFEDKNVGIWSVAVSDIALGGSKAKNYTLLHGSNLPVTDWTTTGAIRPKSITVTAENNSKTYGEADPELTYTVNELVSGDTLAGISLIREPGENVGSYTINVTEDTGKNPNYTITPKSGTFKITEKELTVNLTVEKQFDNTCDLNKEKDTFVYKPVGVVGEDQVGLNADAVTAAFETANEGTDIPVDLTGDFALTGDEAVVKNYTLTQPGGATGRIYNTYDAEVGTDYGVSHDGWTNGAVIITAGENRLLATEIDGEWSTELTYSDEAENTDGRTAAFYVKNADGDISLVESVTYKIDKTNPTGTIALDDMNIWDKLVAGIKFGLFFNYEKSVTITDGDALSGVAKIEYLESADALDRAALEAMGSESWKEYTAPIPVALDDTKKFVYYAKITDTAGNVFYLSTDGAVYDTSAPVIGIQEGTYYTTQTVEITETNLESLTLNGAEVTAPVMLKGNLDAAYTITATDKAGNETTVTVTMKPIAALDDAIADLTQNNATSGDLEDIQSVLETVTELLEDEVLPQSEKDKLKEIQDHAQNLKDAVEEAQDAIDNEVTQKVEDKTETNVELDDKADLENAKDALEDALTEENKGNYTPGEQAEIQKEIDRLEQVLEVIEQTEAVIDAIDALPKFVEPDLSAKTEKAIRDAKDAYDKLTDYQKSLIDKDDQNKLKKLLDTLDDYEIIQGNGQKWEKGSDKNLVFTVNGPDRKFETLLIDGMVAAHSDYTHKNGSTIITLKVSFLQTLTTGKHTIQVVYTDGETDGKDYFRIYNSGSNPSTGDDMNLMLFGGMAVTSLLCIGMMFMCIPEKKGRYQR